MLYSQNGYSANRADLMATFTVPTTPVRITLRKGDTSVVLLYVAEQFHRTVQPLRQKDTGGYNPRMVRGSATVISNHGSGTAEDLNWQLHQRGKRGTFTSAQVKAIRAILAFCEGAVRWGGDYKSAPVDEMHFEIVGSQAVVAKAADKIRAWRAGKGIIAVVAHAAAAAAAPAWPKGTPSFRASNHPKYSTTVLTWQTRMHKRGWPITADGRYGPRSADICHQFQQQKHLHVDGLLGPQTFTAAWTAKVT
jgi:peptidoglycan hydrolase-like protein with peptidoglycan-binding domain